MRPLAVCSQWRTSSRIFMLTSSARSWRACWGPRGAVPRCGHFLQTRPDRRRQPRFRPGGAAGTLRACKRGAPEPSWFPTRSGDRSCRKSMRACAGRPPTGRIARRHHPRAVRPAVPRQDRADPQGRQAARRGSAEGAQQLTATLDGLEEDELLPVARAFNQFLNLANIAEQYHRIRRRRPNEPEPFENLVLEELLGRLKDAGHAPGNWLASSPGWRSNWC